MHCYDETNNDYALQLIYDQNYIALFDTELNTGIHVDFLEGALAHREKFGGGKGQALARAIGLHKLKQPTVIDATAGLARDAYVLASLGCRLTLIEQSPVLCALIDDGIRRALRADEVEHSASNFIRLINDDSQSYLQTLAAEAKPDVIYIDPMYPERKKSARVKKDMQILHRLIGSAADEADLLETARQHARHRVVVKRPAHAEPVSGIKPTMAIASKKTRYDVYINS
jgi:16S rRNA (guanine1516-N2)-methyltransferase